MLTSAWEAVHGLINLSGLVVLSLIELVSFNFIASLFRIFIFILIFILFIFCFPQVDVYLTRAALANPLALHEFYRILKDGLRGLKARDLLVGGLA